MPEVVVLEEEHDRYVPLLSAAGVDATGTNDPAVITDCEILLASPRLAGGAVHASGLGWIQSTWAGVDALARSGVPAGIVVTGLKGVFGTQMREYVLGHLLAHTQRVALREAARSWDEEPPSLIAGSRIGVMGTGSIGSAVARALSGLGVTVRGFNRHGSAVEGFAEVTTDLGAFVGGLDHLVAVLPATPETADLVDAEVLGGLESGAVFINAGRGSTVVTSAVVEALATGRLARAVLDVLPHEPLAEGDPLWNVPGLVITCHTAAWSRPQDVVSVFLDNLARWRRGEPLIGVIDLARGY